MGGGGGGADLPRPGSRTKKSPANRFKVNYDVTYMHATCKAGYEFHENNSNSNVSLYFVGCSIQGA